MKKLVFIIFLLLSGLHSYAQKSYLYLLAQNSSGCRISNDIPSELEGVFGDDRYANMDNMELLSILSGYGYYVEQMRVEAYYKRHDYFTFLLSENNNQFVETKSYILLVHQYSNYYFDLYGNLPNGIKNHYSIIDDKREVGDLLNELSDQGYSLDFFSGNDGSNSFLLSKTSSGNGSSVRGVKTDNNEVTEKARYNLKGEPVITSYKGTQIIVYSDYSTKVVNVK